MPVQTGHKTSHLVLCPAPEGKPEEAAVKDRQRAESVLEKVG
ncbi:hypothetical protein MTo_01427 [Microcystis aeruginosa NIES-1211]|jgi:hypothetical protein|nr:hypothetical protein MTo_01427 [Microcystis aeruginosa NIES-1211]